MNVENWGGDNVPPRGCSWQRRRLAILVGSGDKQDCETKEEHGAEEKRKESERVR